MDLLKTFGPVWDGAGVRGWYGEGYRHHRLVPRLSFSESTFVTKTATWLPRAGNMELTDEHQPRQLFPDCIRVNFRKGLVLNAVGLANPGFPALAENGRWERINEPFFLSIMPVADTESGQYKEAEAFVRYLRDRLPYFAAHRAGRLGLQVNLTCPNAGLAIDELVSRGHGFMSLMKLLGIPLVLKLNVLTPPEAAADLAAHAGCAGLCVSNAVPFGSLSDRIDWARLFPNGSPLAAYGGGGLSGAPILGLVAEWIKAFRRFDAVTHVNGGGGILRKRDVDTLRNAGASSVFFSSAAILRPHRIPSIIRRAHQLYGA